MYASTLEALESTYYKLAPGGYVIIDDYILAACRQAVQDFRKRYGVLEAIHEIDGAGVFWRKET
jgi:O-methyltransferase